jgi:hypothetical protein
VRGCGRQGDDAAVVRLDDARERADDVTSGRALVINSSKVGEDGVAARRAARLGKCRCSCASKTYDESSSPSKRAIGIGLVVRYRQKTRSRSKRGPRSPPCPPSIGTRHTTTRLRAVVGRHAGSCGGSTPSGRRSHSSTGPSAGRDGQREHRSLRRVRRRGHGVGVRHGHVYVRPE